jgi:predicted regulator of Ras-like GTPase activity (Roadblock/LC7/MglB family)
MRPSLNDISSELINEIDGLVGFMLISIDGTIQESQFSAKHSPNLEKYSAMVASAYNVSNNCSHLSGQGRAHSFI